jgi:hypothetical protein
MGIRRCRAVRLFRLGLGLGLAGICLATPAGARVPDQLTGYGKLLFGMTTAEVQALTGQPPEPRGDGVEVIETRQKIAGLPATRILMLEDGQLASIVFQWELEDGTPDAETDACQRLFGMLLGQVTGRYGNPAIGANPGGSEGPKATRSGFAGTSFWAFPDGASIGLVVRGGDALGSGAVRCRGTVNYKQPPGDDASGADGEDAAGGG